MDWKCWEGQHKAWWTHVSDKLNSSSNTCCSKPEINQQTHNISNIKMSLNSLSRCCLLLTGCVTSSENQFPILSLDSRDKLGLMWRKTEPEEKTIYYKFDTTKHKTRCFRSLIHTVHLKYFKKTNTRSVWVWNVGLKLNRLINRLFASDLEQRRCIIWCERTLEKNHSQDLGDRDETRFSRTTINTHTWTSSQKNIQVHHYRPQGLRSYTREMC